MHRPVHGSKMLILIADILVADIFTWRKISLPQVTQRLWRPGPMGQMIQQMLVLLKLLVLLGDVLIPADASDSLSALEP